MDSIVFWIMIMVINVKYNCYIAFLVSHKSTVNGKAH